MAGFPDNLVEAVASAFAPLDAATQDPQKLSQLLADFGWTFDPTSTGGTAAFQQGLGGVLTAVRKVLGDLGQSGGSLATDLPSLIQSVQTAAVQPAGSLVPFNLPQFWQGTGGPGFLQELLCYLIVTYARKTAPLAYGVLSFIGVFKETTQPAVPASGSFPGRAAYMQRLFDPQQIVRAIRNPQNVFSDVYNWGEPGGKPFQAEQLLRSMAAIFAGFNVGTSVATASDSLYGLYYNRLASSPANLPVLSVMPLYYMAAGHAVGGNFKISLNALPIPHAQTRTGPPWGIVLFPLVTGQAGATTQIATNVTISLNGSFLVVPVFMEIRPTGVAIAPLQSSASVSTFNTEARVDAKARQGSSWTLIGDPAKSHVALSGIHFSISASGPITDLTFKVEVGFDDLALFVNFGDADSFLSSIFGTGNQPIQGSFSIAWSNKTGFCFNGQRSLSATIPTHQTILNAITLDKVVVALTPSASAAALDVGASGNVILGPVVATVDQVGFSIKVDAQPQTGAANNAGLLAATVGFKPPSGIGLVVDAPEVTGGGYLFFDTQKEQYAGVLQLELAGTIALKAIGLLTTRMPDGSKGFSLLVIITVEGFEPIELGFGFTLSGVGGLLGVNRTTAVDVLRSGIKSGTVGSILFPDDPVRNAPRIISDLSSVFPPAQNRYVFGPMLMIDWGTPAILTMEIGLVLEIPDPVRLLILGRLEAALPDASNALVLIHMDSLGVIDFGKGEISLDATLYDSRLLSFVLTGDMALRAEFGRDPSFLLAIGGWNPRFPSPAGFPSLSRMAITLSSTADARLRLESYLAITSNTLQFGARADFYFAVQPFSVEGYLGFDALFHFAPSFSFIADLSASVALKMNGDVLMSVGLNMSLSGPSPWHVWGTAQFSILGFHQSISIDAQYGPAPQPTLPPPVDVQALLKAALNDVRNWTSELPMDERPLVVFRTSSTAQEVLRVHPLAELVVRERVAPLGMTITRFGDAPVSGDNRFTLTAVRSDDGSAIPSVEDITDSFALAQFTDMSDDQKLSSPAFTRENAGIRFTTGEFTYGYEPALDSSVTYNTLMILPGQAAQNLPAYTMSAAVLDAAATFGAAAQAA